jgi:sugar transferase (PEP-CTERM/EpsH1 system associated)
VFIYSSNVAPYILDLHGRERVRLVDLVDVDSEKWRTYSRNVNWPMSTIYRREWHRLAKIEARIVRECDWSTLVSAAEARLFARLHPTEAHKIYGISNGVDHVFFDPSLPFDPPFATDCANFVFTGTMDYLPNVDAVAWFVEDILPIIRRCAPNAKFHIVGSHPSPTVQALTETQGVFVTGRVADVRPYIAHASAAVAPMRVARGIQNKVLEAMAMGKPVVVTGGGLEGIDAIPGIEVLMAETPEVFAAACLRAASGECAAIGSAARHRVLRDYIWSERLRSFDRLLAEPLDVARNSGHGVLTPPSP